MAAINARSSVNVERLLTLGGLNLNCSDVGQHPLCAAATCGNLEIVFLLVQRGALVDGKDFYQRTALSYATQAQHLVVAQLLLEYGANINAVNLDGETALHRSAAAGNQKAVQWLLDHDADTTLKMTNGKTAHQCAKIIDVWMVDLILGYEVTKSLRPYPNHQTLLQAINDRSIDDVQRVLALGGVALKPEHRVSQYNALSQAAIRGMTKTVDMLIQHGADVNWEDHFGQNALWGAITKNQIRSADVLFASGTQVKERDATGQILLHTPFLNVDTIKWLLEHGADRTLVGPRGRTLEADTRQVDIANVLRDYFPAVVPSPPPRIIAIVPPEKPIRDTPEMTNASGDDATLRAELAACRRQLRQREEELVVMRAEKTAADTSHRAALADAEQARLTAVVGASESTTKLETAQAAHAEPIAKLEEDLRVARQPPPDQMTEPVIAVDELQLSDRVLGHGALGEVRAGTWLGTKVAVKRLFALGGGGGGGAGSSSHSAYGTLTAEEKDGVVRELRREIDALARLRSPFLVHFFGYTCDTTGSLDCIVIEQLQSVSLAAAFAAAPQVLTCIAHALQYLHGRRIIHRDVKLSNILFDPEKKVYKLSDLGESKVLDRRTTHQTMGRRGTPAYMAPEIKVSVEGDLPTPAADVFSFGVLALEVLTNFSPSPGGPESRRVPGQRAVELVPEVERRAGDLARLAERVPVKAMIIRCLAMNPEDRPTAKECAEQLVDLEA